MSAVPRLARVADRLWNSEMIAKLTGKRDDNASFVVYMFPYKHDRREYIMGIGG